MTDVPTLLAEPISPEAFAPFGVVLAAPSELGRIYYDQGLANTRRNASASISIAHIAEAQSMPITAVEMERHAFSSQSFIPMDVSRYLVVAAPHDVNGAPDAQRAKAFIVPGDVGITYGVDVWHHPITVLGRPGVFAVQMWRDGTASDEEFVKLERPFRIDLS
ncbi:MAG: ureidoglycolate lyase, partial [Pseudomonadota bacterium]